MIDEEISRILTEQEQRAHDLLVKHRKGLDLVAEALLEQETIDGALVARLIQKGIDRNVEGNSSGESAGRPEHDTL
jgi:cell division protease FtsH